MAVPSKKYAALPDIDNAPDVYETADPPAHIETEDEEARFAEGRARAAPEGESEAIRHENVNAFGAYSLFRARELGSSATSRLIAGAGESPVDKLARLRAEIDALEKETAAGGVMASTSAESDLVGAAAEVRALRDRLEHITLGRVSGTPFASVPLSGALEHALAALESGDGNALPGGVVGSGGGVVGAAGQVTYELYYRPEAAKSEKFSALVDLEKRIAAAEATIGRQNGEPLSDALARLRKKIALLDIQTIKDIDRKLRTTATLLDAVSAKRAAAPTLTDGSSEKIDALYGLAMRWDAIAAAVPTIADRLKALEAIHSQRASLASRVARAEAEAQRTNESLAVDLETLVTLKASLAENMGTIKSNMEALDRRIEAIAKKVAGAQ